MPAARMPQIRPESERLPVLPPLTVAGLGVAYICTYGNLSRAEPRCQGPHRRRRVGADPGLLRPLCAAGSFLSDHVASLSWTPVPLLAHGVPGPAVIRAITSCRPGRGGRPDSSVAEAGDRRSGRQLRSEGSPSRDSRSFPGLSSGGVGLRRSWPNVFSHLGPVRRLRSILCWPSVSQASTRRSRGHGAVTRHGPAVDVSVDA